MGGWVIVVLPNITKESVTLDTRILLEGRDAYGRRISTKTVLRGEDPWNRIFNPNAVEYGSPQPNNP
jgi:hypothetical protein